MRAKHLISNHFLMSFLIEFVYKIMAAAWSWLMQVHMHYLCLCSHRGAIVRELPQYDEIESLWADSRSTIS